MGGLRAVAQTVSYEIVFSFMFLVYAAIIGFSFVSNLRGLWLRVGLAVFILCCLAESMRTPFDFVEGESELVSGFNTEYRGILFVLIFLGEYAALMLLGSLTVWIWLNFARLALSAVGAMFAILLLIPRAVLPRLRYDQLIYLAWKALLPFILRVVVMTGVLFGDEVF